VSVTAAQGFRASGVAAGLKSSGRPDIAVVASDEIATAAGVFTTNRVQAAPVQLSRRVLRRGRLRAVVLNSGGANACTGADGLADAEQTAATAAEALGCRVEEVAVASTGLIGVRLRMELVVPGVRAACAALSVNGETDAATAIMTTDTVAKESVRTAGYDTGVVTVGGMAKGAGMLAPSLATMLVVLTTDADVAADHLDLALRSAVNETFDLVDADGCMSTNDAVYLLASGASGVPLSPGNAAWRRFVSSVTECCADLAEQLVDDAEGASKRITIEVTRAADDAQARDAARTVARNALLKCAIHGADPNWGRVLAAVGTSTAEFDPHRVDVDICGVPVCRAGVAAGRLEEARAAMQGRVVSVRIDLHAGDASCTVQTTDLTAEYVHENSAYST
jgi:glutamate N-acetyltransferase / amino-acid N-acetyltransferase